MPGSLAGRPQPPNNMNRLLKHFVADEPALVAAKDAAHAFISAIMRGPYRDGYCLTLCGRSGTGKTMLARCIMNELKFNRWNSCDAIQVDVVAGAVRRFVAGFYDMRKVSDKFKNGQYGIVEDIESRNLVVLDDIGADYDPAKITVSKVDRILRSRTSKWTVLTINLPLNKIAEQLDARIASFVIRDENRFVEIQTQDYAMRKFKK